MEISIKWNTLEWVNDPCCNPYNNHRSYSYSEPIALLHIVLSSGRSRTARPNPAHRWWTWLASTWMVGNHSLLCTYLLRLPKTTHPKWIHTPTFLFAEMLAHFFSDIFLLACHRQKICLQKLWYEYMSFKLNFSVCNLYTFENSLNCV